ncbi:histidine phosphatase family protein [Sphingobium sp. SCG-1]|uniref:histidine phosphatase family protein n=1 Tax=Sphingobium sp. SCG-1 TaxID=2072936 RepID=UPI000CD6BD75|nr:histidine phosphatase family protein [Sphingobium sp. SCG-1]AUW57294.1 histidine phosphatase family protein [Sphingobium sp. SCG-1]
MTVPLLLVRHAAHGHLGRILTGRGSDIALSSDGVTQAERLAQALTDWPVAAIYSSPQHRCRQTAAIIGDRLALAVQTSDALDEIDFGEWTGREFTDLEQDALWHRWNTTRSKTQPPGGERMTKAIERVAAFLDKLGAGDAQTVLCVTHADIIRGAIAHYLGLSLDNILRFDVDPASLSTLQFEGGQARLTTLNRVFA